jgi:hypothetical protein
MTLARRHLGRCLTGLVLLAGCSYQDPDSAPPLGMNTCTPETACGPGAECRDGMCVAKSADMTLNIALQVLPVRMPDGSEPQPIVLERFTVDGPMNRTFELPMPVEVNGYVRNIENDPATPIQAAVSFTPVGLARGLPVSKVMTTTSIVAPDSVNTVDFVVQLLPDVEYRLAVQPGDASLPPQYRTLRVEAGMVISVEYGAAADAPTRAYEIVEADRAAPEDLPLLVRAYDRDTSELLSSTATVTADGSAVLRFAEEPGPLRLEVQAEESYDDEQPEPDEMWCDTKTAIFPVLSFEPDETAGVDDIEQIVLPELPERIRFEGTVALCEAAERAQAMRTSMAEAAVAPTESLPITLHSRQLLDADGEPLAAAFEATTMATRDEESGELHFCVQVMPGEYDVLATPGASVPCAQFAEHFPISAPEGQDASGPLLQLPLPAYLKGTVRKVNGSPLSQAVVDAVALGRNEGLMLEASDRSVARYNRSQQTTTGNQGEFELLVDLGSYDVLFKPPLGSGFSWQVHHDVAIGKRDQDFPNVIPMNSPVVLNGTLSYRRENTSFEGAEVAAFAIIEDEFDTERAIPVGRAIADADGNFMLLLPASLKKGW